MACQRNSAQLPFEDEVQDEVQDEARERVKSLGKMPRGYWHQEKFDTMYARILIPLDSSDLAEQVLPLVRYFGNGLQSPVHLMSVIQEIPEELANSLGVDQNEITVGWRMQAQNYLEAVSSRLRQQGLQTSFLISQGETASSILSEAEKDPATLVAMSTHGWAGAARWNLGSVTLKVLQSATNPVLVFRAQYEAKEDLQNERPIANIIVPLDGSAVSEEAIPHAITLAKAHSSKVTLLRVTPSGWDYYSHMDHGVLHSGDMSKVARDRAKGYLDTVADKLKGQGSPLVESRLARGEPAGSIIDLAEDTPCSLVAMVTHGQGGARRWSMGSVAQRVAGGCQVPVLVVPATGRGQDQ